MRCFTATTPALSCPAARAHHGQARFMYCLRNSQTPLVDKMALFWHQVFATGKLKSRQLQRGAGPNHHVPPALEWATIGSYWCVWRKTPAMIFWLDNNENHRDAVNENWGRELLELFSMGLTTPRD